MNVLISQHFDRELRAQFKKVIVCVKRLIFDMMDGRKVMPNNELRFFSRSSPPVFLHVRSTYFLFECLPNKDEAAIRCAITRQKRWKITECPFKQLEMCAHTVIMLFLCDPKIRYDRLNGLMNFLLFLVSAHQASATFSTLSVCDMMTWYNS